MGSEVCELGEKVVKQTYPEGSGGEETAFFRFSQVQGKSVHSSVGWQLAANAIFAARTARSTCLQRRPRGARALLALLALLEMECTGHARPPCR